MRALFVRVSIAFALLFAASSVQAQEVALSPRNADQKDEAEHPRGSYMGVKPGGPEAPAIPATPGATPAGITWPGFQMRPDGSSRVFLQTTSPVTVVPVMRDGKLIVDLGDARVEGETNRLPLFTQFFNTPVTRIEIKRENNRTLLEISLRVAVEPRVSGEQAPSGFHFVYLDFPAGSYLGKPLPPLTANPKAAGDPQPEAPAHLEGDVSGSASGKAKASASADASMDAELPPGQAKGKAKGKAKAGFTIGK